MEAKDIENKDSTILAIDPGPKESAYVLWDAENKKVINKEYLANGILLSSIYYIEADYVVIEGVTNYGMPVGNNIFEMLLWVGRFYEAAKNNKNIYTKPVPVIIYRNDIQIHFCNTKKASKSNVNMVLTNRFGKKGTKENPGILYGITYHIWDALALAVYWGDKLKENN